MQPDRLPSPAGDTVVCWSADTAAGEAGYIAGMILDLHETGVAYGDMAVLVRGRASYPALIDAFTTFGIPVQPGGRTGLFDAPEAILLGKTFCWRADVDWRRSYGGGERVTEDDLIAGYRALCGVDNAMVGALRSFLRDWHQHAHQQQKRLDLVGELYELCDVIGVGQWAPDDETTTNRLGVLARFTMLLADYESVRRRARPDAEVPGEQVGGQDRGSWYYKNLAFHITNYAQGAYEGFDGEPDVDLDAVDLLTVHRAKGLEWPVVFVPAMTATRFLDQCPASRRSAGHVLALPVLHVRAPPDERTDVSQRIESFVRAHEDPSRWELIVRGRPLSVDGILRTAARSQSEFTWRERPFTAVSAEVTGPGRTLVEVLAGARLRTRATYAVASVDDVVAAGFPVLATFAAPHVSVVLPEYDARYAVALLDLLRPERQNPYYERRSR